MAYVSVEVDVDLDDFEDDVLIDELEGRGWFVSEYEPNDQLTEDEITAILERFQMAVPGTTGYNIYEKLRKR